ncbi:sporulation protein rmd1 [Lecanora helva]
MASTSTERSPLLPRPPPSPVSSFQHPPKPQRTVTFSPHTTVSSPSDPVPATSPLRPSAQQSQPKLSALNSKLRRRNSHGSPLSQPPMVAAPASKIGPQRTTKNAQKLKLLPDPDPGDEGPDEESGRDVYSQFTRIKDPTARRDAARLGKSDRDKLPRVTAYCTASSYRIEGLMRYLKSRARTRGAVPKQFDECIYTPYTYGRSRNAQRRKLSMETDTMSGDEQEPDTAQNQERRYSDSALEVEENQHQRREDLIDLSTAAGDTTLDDGESSLPNHTLPDLDQQDPSAALSSADFDITVHHPEIFLFEYGTVVIWGMTLAEESRFLKEISKFESEKLSADDVQTENFNFYYTREYQARIYNDFISLREKKNYMTKLAISHALAQSVKTSLFEDLLTTTITLTSPLPAEIALTGSISLNRRQIHQQIGQLFILRINIHLQGSVLDSPELMWAEPSLEPVYAAVRSYLEMDQRVGLLTERLSVIGDLLAVLKDQVGTKHGEYLEWIVIVLIAAEILVAAINIVVDLYAGVD